MIRTALVLLLALGCAGQSSSPQSDPHFTPVESLGRRIYEADRAAWVATDAALAAGARKSPIRGWITVPRDDGWLVRFVGPCGADVCSLVDVAVDAAGKTTPRVANDALPEDELAEWNARELAVHSSFRRCTPTYNTVVLSDVREGQAVWLVYLLAASKNDDDVVLGGHHRITVNANGTEILKSEPLSKSCIVMKRAAAEGSVGLMVTHVLDPEPIETHVFASLVYRTPVYVTTAKGLYAVENGRIRKVE